VSAHTHLDDLEHIRVGGLTWRPVRRVLGATAFGVNAWTADAAGDEVIESHTEGTPSSPGHEELYLVAAGRATFSVGEEEIDAPTGTLVLVEVGTPRSAVAAEPGTTVVVIGGEPGAAGPRSAWEHYYAAQPAYDEGDYDKAAAIASEGLRDWPDHGPLNYQLACFQALAGHLDEARAHLDIAFANDERTREWAADDEDLAALRD
jgi:mannose-6-phosphate isomerase-like protein (cupin superfamily)